MKLNDDGLIVLYGPTNPLHVFSEVLITTSLCLLGDKVYRSDKPKTRAEDPCYGEY